MTKKDIVRTISEEVGLTQQQTKKIVQKTFDAIIESLVRERRIELRNFGVFEVKSRAARKARNPRTGDEVIVPKKHVVTFKPGKHMEAKVRDLDDDQSDGSDASNESSTESETNESENLNSHSGRWDTD
ncbi:MAG: integration host factor subunit beta [Pirellulaceae bacterium]|nr:integration host factor subunit beta [Pirellulaceae bacterium]